MKITILGCRGSIPAGGPSYSKYGSDTSSYLIESGGQALILDAGSGIARCPDLDVKEISLLISHFHIDHILGLTFFPFLSKACRINIYSALPSIESKSLMDRLFSPPLWPCLLEDYTADINYHRLSSTTTIGNLNIRYMDSNHPDGSVIFRVEDKTSSLVYATDYEYTDEEQRLLSDFSKDASLIIYDGQYTKEQYERLHGFGHSTKESGIELLKSSGAKSIVFTHHDPHHDDSFLDAESQRLKELCPQSSLACIGKVIEL